MVHSEAMPLVPTLRVGTQTWDGFPNPSDWMDGLGNPSYG